MIDLEEIDATIEELENGRITLQTCNDLANLYIIKDHLLSEDLLPNSTVDETMGDVQELLVKYMIERDIITLNILLSNLTKIISELYHTTTNPTEIVEFKEFIQNLNCIIK